MRYTLIVLLSIFFISGCQLNSKKPVEQKAAAPVDQVVQQPQEPALPSSVNLPYVIYEDAGLSGKLIGCNDSLVLAPLQVPATVTNRQGLLSRMYTDLLAKNSIGTYESALPVNGLTLQSLTTSPSGVHVAFVGSLPIGGTCDAPRISEQLTTIASQFPHLTTIKITINGTLLADYLSTK